MSSTTVYIDQSIHIDVLIDIKVDDQKNYAKSKPIKTFIKDTNYNFIEPF